MIASSEVRSFALIASKAEIATSIISASGSRVVKRWSQRFGATKGFAQVKRNRLAENRMYSYASEASSGRSRIRLNNRGISERGPIALKSRMEKTTTVSRKAVPQRGQNPA